MHTAVNSGRGEAARYTTGTTCSTLSCCRPSGRGEAARCAVATDK